MLNSQLPQWPFMLNSQTSLEQRPEQLFFELRLNLCATFVSNFFIISIVTLNLISTCTFIINITSKMYFPVVTNYVCGFLFIRC